MEENDIEKLYRQWFLDYASYVILERAVPSGEDGLKPVQRRILHAMSAMDDGRSHKVANIIGQTMQYHPHGDAAIGEAVVNLGQKNLLLETQGNWGDVRTGDNAAASRYIEAKLSDFAHDIAFSPDITDWQLSYDGRKKEPVSLPVKFPLLLALGVEGIAVGLSTRILPHNFIELIDASIDILKGNPCHIFPDFPTGGLADFSDYNEGQKGGKVRVRATVKITPEKDLVIRDIPFGVTTGALIDSIVKANENGKIKVKRIVDNTAGEVEIVVELPPGASPEITADALYAFTDCEVSISPNCCVIVGGRPRFLGVDELLRLSTTHTVSLLKRELEVRMQNLAEKRHFAVLEKIFIQERIYRDLETATTWEEATGRIAQSLTLWEKDLSRPVSAEDVTRLTDIKIRRISKYDRVKAAEDIVALEAGIAQVTHHLSHLTDYAIDYFRSLREKYGKGRERRTRIKTFEVIQATSVALANQKLYVDRKEGFIGYGLKNDEFVCDCSDLDDVIVFLRNGHFLVTRISSKSFVGKDIIHAAVWKKNDSRMVYNMAYRDGADGPCLVKRFSVMAITRDTDYDLTRGAKGSKVLYFTANPNGEVEVIAVHLNPGCRAKNKEFDFSFKELAVKGRTAQGNILTKYPVSRITQKEAGIWTGEDLSVWYDSATGRLNNDNHGIALGTFNGEDLLLAVSQAGAYHLRPFDMAARYDPETTLLVEKYSPQTIITAVHYDGDKKYHFVKRFQIETQAAGREFKFITDHPDSRLLFVSTKAQPHICLEYEKKRPKQTVQQVIDLSEFIDVKGWKAVGNRLSLYPVLAVREAAPPAESAPAEPIPQEQHTAPEAETPQNSDSYVQDSFLDIDFWDNE